MRLTFRLSVVISLFLLAACGSNLSVSTIQLGRSLNADGSVGSHTTRLIKVRWTYSGKVMGEPTKEVRGAAATEFHLQSAGGLPPGDYAVEAFLDGISAGTRDFRVDIKK